MRRKQTRGKAKEQEFRRNTTAASRFIHSATFDCVRLHAQIRKWATDMQPPAPPGGRSCLDWRRYNELHFSGYLISNSDSINAFEWPPNARFTLCTQVHFRQEHSEGSADFVHRKRTSFWACCPHSVRAVGKLWVAEISCWMVVLTLRGRCAPKTRWGQVTLAF